MPVTATFVADFTKWNQALKDAVRTFEPLELKTKNVNAELARMAKSFSGEAIIRQAKLATAAIGDIENVTKLTTAEQKRLNATVTEAIAKYSALGQKAPADMLALAKATKQSESAFSGIASALGPIKGLLAGAFAVGSITRLAGETLKFASDLNDLSAKTGLSTKALQEFKFAGDQVGVTLDDVSNAVFQMQKHLEGGDKSVDAALKRIGLSFKELKGLAPEEQFKLIASGLEKIEDPAVRSKTAFDLMGKAAITVMPLITADLSKAAAEAERLGVVLDQKTVNALDNLGDTWAKLKISGEALIANVLAPMAPLLSSILTRLAKDMGKLNEDIKKVEISFIQLGVIVASKTGLGNTSAVQTMIAKVGELQREITNGGTASALISAAKNADMFSKSIHGAGDETTKASEKVHTGTDLIREDLGKVAAALERVEERSDAAFEALNQADELTAVKQQFDQIANRLGKVDQAETEWLEGTSHLLENKSTVVKRYFDGLLKQQEESHKGWDQFTKDLGDLSSAFAQLAQISGGALGGIAGLLSKLVGSANLAVKAVGGISAGISAVKAAKGIKDMVGGFAQLTTGILGAVSAALEFGAALADALHRSRPEQLQSSVFHDFGVKIGEDLGKTIADSAISEFHGSFTAAQIGNLDKIIAAGGGITLQNLDKLEARLHDVFSLLQTGELTAGQAQDVLNKNFQTFVDFLGGDVNPALKEIIRLNKEFGTQSKAIMDFIAKNADRAASGFNKIATNFLTLTTGFQSGSDDMKMLQDAIDGVTDSTKKVAKEAPEAHRGIEELKRAANTGFSNDFIDNLQDGLKKIGPLAQAAFGALLDGGKSVTEALAELAPGLQQIEKVLKATGQQADGFLGQIIGWEDIVSKNKELFDILSGVDDMLHGLNNAGALTQDAFSALTGTISDAFTQLTIQGVQGADAIKLMQPQLQEVWELQKDFGFAVDDATQKLLDQAVAAGEVGEKHRSVQEQMLDLQKQELAVLTAIGKAFGVTLPDAIGDTGNAFDDLGRKAKDALGQIPRDINIGVHYRAEDFPHNGSAIPFSSGGLVPYLPKSFANGGMVPSEAMLKRAAPIYAAGGFFTPRGSDTVPAMLSPGEFVISRKGVQNAGVPTLRSINNGVTPVGGGSVTNIFNVYVQNELSEASSKKLATALAPHIPDAVANGGSTHGKWQRMTKSLAK